MSIYADILHPSHTREIMWHEAPHLMPHIERMAQQVGIKMPRLFMLESGPLSPFPNAMAMSNKRVILTNPLLKTLNSTLDGPPSAELLSIVGHELGHLRVHPTETAMRRLPILLMPFACVAGLLLYDRAKERAKDRAVTHEDINHVANAERAELAKRAPASHLHTLGADLLQVGCYVAVAAAGLAAGLLGARLVSNHYEFRHDKLGAKLVDPQAMMRALQWVERDALNIHKEMGGKKPHLMAQLINATLYAHPETPARVARLAAM